MLKTATFILVAAIGTMSFAVAAYADAKGDDGPPACPGGTVKGTITCTGPVLTPTCTEGAPWTCTLDGKVSSIGGIDIGGGNGNGRNRFNFGNIGFGGGLVLQGNAGGNGRPGRGAGAFGGSQLLLH